MHTRPIVRALLGSLAAALSLTACIPLLPGEPYDLRGQTVSVTFLHTSDIHSRLLPYDYAPIKTDIDLGILPEGGPYGGATRIAAVIERERARAERVVHLDSGDSFQGAPIFNQNTGEVEYRFLSQARLDAAVIGNHEFDAGALNFALKARDYASFPVLAANYIWESSQALGSNQTSLYTAPYTIKNVKGLRVGIIGMANVSTLNSLVEGGNSLQATPFEQNEALRAYVDLLRPMVDLVLVTSHLGLHEDQDLINGYDAYFEYGDIRSFISCDEPYLSDDRFAGQKCRERTGWQVLEWFGANPSHPDTTRELLNASVVRVWIPGVSGVDAVFGGHLHVVLNPPQTLRDPSGRKVLLVHSGAFAKYVGRVDAVVKVPEADADPAVIDEGAEILSHDYRVFPMDALWCDDALHAYYKGNFWNVGQFRADAKVQDGIARCQALEDLDTTQLLLPYIIDLDLNLRLSSIFAYTPKDIARRNNATGGDSPLGNMAADSMRIRQRVEAEVALTNTLGIRDNLYAGPLTQEAMFNVFPFENTINIMYLSGTEMQELFDFVASRSASRGCQSQAQISGATFTMDCAQAQLNDLRYACSAATDCPTDNREGRAPWQCLEDLAGRRCWAHPGINIKIRGKDLDRNGVYKIAVNDYIAKGGSGFSVLKRNTTRIETGIPLRDSLIGYMKNFCSCEDILRPHPDTAYPVDESGRPCGVPLPGDAPGSYTYYLDPQIVSFCSTTAAFQEEVSRTVFEGCTCADVLGGNTTACGAIDDTLRSQCATTTAGPFLGKCSCRDVLQNNTLLCGNITQPLRAFCGQPAKMAIAIGLEDNRISRRLK